MAERALIENTENETPFTSTTNGLRFPKDSKWAWIVCACSFLTQVLILGILHAFGVFFVEFIEEFKTSKGAAAWVGSVAYGLSMTVGPFVSMLVRKIGHRRVMMIGGTMCAISVLSSSFVNSFSLLFLTFSVFFGVGAGLAITPTMTVGQEYFDKYASISVGIMTAGSSIGTLITAPLAQALVQAIGWRNTFRFFAGTCTLTVAFNTLIRPIYVQEKTPSQQIRASPARKLMEELKLWKDRVFVVWTAGITCVMFGYYIPYVHLVSYAVDNGISQEQGSMLVMILGGVTATGRVLFGKVVQYGFLNRLHMHQLSMVITGAGTMLLPLIKSFGGLAAYVTIIGLVDGCYVVLLPLLTCSLVGSDQAVLAWGFLVGTSSITFTLGPPVAGFMYDAIGSYNVAFHVAGLPVLAGALILFLIPWAQRTSRSSKIIKVINVVQMHDQDDVSNVDFITLSKCSSVADAETSTSQEGVDDASSTHIDLNDLYFSDINQDTVVPRSPGGRRALREVDFALSALQKSDQVLSKMLGGGRRNQTQRRDIPLQTDSTHSHTSAGKGSCRKSNVINISTSTNSPGNRRNKSSSHSHSDREEEKSFDDVGVQADLISTDSHTDSPLQSGLASGVSFKPFHPTASALYQTILVLEQQQQQQLQQSASNLFSEGSRVSMASGNQPTTPLLEEFVTGQLERLRESLIESMRSPNRSCDHVRSRGSSGIQSWSGENQDQTRSGLSGPSSRVSRGSNHYQIPSHPTRSEGTQTGQPNMDEQEVDTCFHVGSPYQQISATSPWDSGSHTTNQQEGYRMTTGSTPVDIPSTPVQAEDLEVFSMDPLSPFGSPPSEIPRIPTPPPRRQYSHAETTGSLDASPVLVRTCLNQLGNTEGGYIFTMDPSPQADDVVGSTLHSPERNVASTSCSVQPRENLSSKTLSGSDGVFKMDEDHFGYMPTLQACAESPADSCEKSHSNIIPGAPSGTPVTVQTGRFTVDTFSWPDDNSDYIPPISPPPSVNAHHTTDHGSDSKARDHQPDLLTQIEQSPNQGRSFQSTSGDLDLRSFNGQTNQPGNDSSARHDNDVVDHDQITLTGEETGRGSQRFDVVPDDDIMFSLDPLDESTARTYGTEAHESSECSDNVPSDVSIVHSARGSGGFNIQKPTL